MDWITFIKWNGIAYATYYGVNLLVDYLKTSGRLSPIPNHKEYHLTDLGIEETRVVKSSDFLYVNKEGEQTEKKPEPAHQQGESKHIQFNAPIERQGMPVNDFVKVAVQSGNEIFQATI